MSETAGLRDEPFEADVTASELVYAGRVWDVRSDTVRYGDGEILCWEFILDIAVSIAVNFL